MYKFTLAVVSLFFLFSAPASAVGASDQKWVVTQLSGDARVVRPGLQAASISVRTQLSPGDKLLTGPTGRATLVKGQDYIVVAPRSELRVPTAAQPTGFTRVIQTLGTLLFKVQHTGVPHFAVDTPMLAAVVKGTTFTVTVDQQRSAIQVTQGVVQVTAVDGGMMRLVEGGKTVFLNHLAPKVLLDADKPLPTSPAPSATSVTVSAESDTPLTAIATLTDGLVRAELTAQPAIVKASAPVATPVVEPVRATGAAQPATTTVVAATPVADTTVTVSPAVAASTATNVAVSTTVSTPVAAPVSATVSVSTTPVVAASTPIVSVATTAPTTTAAPTVTAAVTTPIISTTTASITTPTVTTTAVTTPTVTVPAVTTPVVSTSPVTIPTVTIGSNSGPGSMSSGSNSGPGSLNSGPGSISSGPPVTVAAISTPTVTVPAITTPIVPISTPTVTVPAITTPTVTVPSILSGLKL